jgi:hypothetical protein
MVRKAKALWSPRSSRPKSLWTRSLAELGRRAWFEALWLVRRTNLYSRNSPPRLGCTDESARNK